MQKHLVLLAIFFFLWLLPLAISLRIILSGNLPFWFDPARDLLMGIDLHQKFSLIGPESGIPKIFYGPYWWWLMGLGTLFTKDPRYITIAVLTVPYFTLFPMLLWKFRPFVGTIPVVTVWGFFIFHLSQYTTQLWNPHVAPLLLLLLLYLLASTDYAARKLAGLRMLAAGFTYGLLGNFNPSFLLMTFPGVTIFLLAVCSKQKLSRIFFAGALVAVGAILAFSPLILFETRHGFMQTKALIKIITDAVFYHTPAVGQTGYTHSQILYIFSGTLSKVLNLPQVASYILYFQIITVLPYLWIKRSLQLARPQKRLALLLCLASASLLGMSLVSENPVYSYHFMGAEILFLLALALLFRIVTAFRVMGVAWVTVVVVMTLYYFLYPKPYNPLSLESYRAKRHVVELIYQDAGSSNFAILAYSPAIHTYDYDYVIKWVIGPAYSKYTMRTPENATYIYLIIPDVPEAIKLDFIDYKTPNRQYKTLAQWEIPNGTTVVKRARL